jgi:hypothetical protein
MLARAAGLLNEVVMIGSSLKFVAGWDLRVDYNPVIAQLNCLLSLLALPRTDIRGDSGTSTAANAPSMNSSSF